MVEVIFNGPEGRLEGRYTHSEASAAPIALILHPDPRYGGSMNNRVVFALHQTFVRKGFPTLRFNFRGVGRSVGAFDYGEGELSDAASALDWLQGYNTGASQCWITGFSFGAWIAMQLLMRRPEITSFIAVAPPANMYDFSFLAPCPSSGLFLHGTADEIVPAEEVAKLGEKLTRLRSIAIEMALIEGANHLFQNHTDDVSNVVERYLVDARARIAAGEAAALADEEAAKAASAKAKAAAR